MWRPSLMLRPLYRAEGDPLPPSVGDPAPDPPSPSRERHRCEFCDCTLTHRGQVLNMSDKARKLRDQTETVDQLQRDLAKAQSDLNAAREELTALKNPASRPAARGWSPVTVG